MIQWKKNWGRKTITLGQRRWKQFSYREKDTTTAHHKHTDISLLEANRSVYYWFSWEILLKFHAVIPDFPLNWLCRTLWILKWLNWTTGSQIWFGNLVALICLIRCHNTTSQHETNQIYIKSLNFTSGLENNKTLHFNSLGMWIHSI